MFTIKGQPGKALDVDSLRIKELFWEGTFARMYCMKERLILNWICLPVDHLTFCLGI